MRNLITMKLFIEKGTLADDVKKIFTSCYPFLKIELYKKPLTNSLHKKEVTYPFQDKFINAKKKKKSFAC